jgi:hypothetical protein
VTRDVPTVHDTAQSGMSLLDLLVEMSTARLQEHCSLTVSDRKLRAAVVHAAAATAAAAVAAAAATAAAAAAAAAAAPAAAAAATLCSRLGRSVTQQPDTKLCTIDTELLAQLYTSAVAAAATATVDHTDCTSGSSSTDTSSSRVTSAAECTNENHSNSLSMAVYYSKSS